MKIDFEGFVKERDEALLSLDKEKIMAYMEKYGVKVPESELVFWAGVHKSITTLRNATEEQKEKSRAWLAEHGFKPYF